MTESTSAALHVSDLRKSFPSGAGPLWVLNGVNLVLETGDALAVTGPSGCGKSTLLHVIGTLEPPTSGLIRFGDVNPVDLAERDLAAYRNRHIGFVFQDHHLLPQLTVLENVLVPTLVAGPDSRSGAEDRARALLDRVGLAERLSHRPGELSGGERQRVAIARALINRPRLLLCDEPTGNLDSETAEEVGTLFLELQGEQEGLLIVVTHSLALAERFPRRAVLRQGRLEETSRADA